VEVGRLRNDAIDAAYRTKYHHYSELRNAHDQAQCASDDDKLVPRSTDSYGWTQWAGTTGLTELSDERSSSTRR